jgi:pimeloyl-ACP methyl ester carboxylesterase
VFLPRLSLETSVFSVPGGHHEIETPVGGLSYYAATEGGGVPLLLIHSVNAAASAYETKPLIDRYRGSRPIYALELPGFGRSEHSERAYTPRLMTDALHAMIDEIYRLHGVRKIDALALSLSCEFLARTAVERPDCFRSLALVSPTGLDRLGPYLGVAGSTRGKPLLLKMLNGRPWRKTLFALLTKRPIIRLFLQKTWGSRDIDEGLLDYSVFITQQAGAELAPFWFLSFYLFSNDVTHVYDALSLPTWVAHGIRGDFTDYSGLKRFEGKTNWTVDVFPTGAYPHFEMIDRFAECYDAFIAKAYAF